MELNMPERKSDFNSNGADKLSARMSVFAWIICAVLGWALAFTSFTTITGNNDSATITAQNEPSAEDAATMEQILPAAGGNQEN